MTGTSDDRDDNQPLTLANMIRKKIAEHNAANPDAPYKKPEPQEVDFSQYFKGNAPEAGSALGSYDLLKLIHSGQSANIFLAKHSLMDKEVVVKILKSEHCQNTLKVKRLQEESRTMSRMNDPRIANTIDFGIATSGHPYIIMIPVEAQSLRELLDRVGNPSVFLALQIIDQLAEILAFLHGLDIKYGNLKPGHVLVGNADSDKISLTLVDFSGAQRQDTVLPQELTSLDGAPYMSPEQAREQAIEVRSDVYSLACLAFELLTGLAPFSEQSVEDYQKAHSSKKPRTIENSTLPAAVHQVLLKGLNKNPADRYETAQAFAKDLRENFDPISLS